MKLGERPVAEFDPRHLATGIEEPVDAPVTGQGHTQKGIAVVRRQAAAVACRDPTLDHLELLGDAGAKRHEVDAALGGQIGFVSRPVRHAASDDARRAIGRARVGSPRVRVERTLAALGVAGIVEIVQVASRDVAVLGHQRLAALAASHHPFLQIDACLRRGGVGPREGLLEHRVEHVDTLADLAQHEKTAVVQQDVGVGRIGAVAAVVGVAEKNFAARNAVVPDA